MNTSTNHRAFIGLMPWKGAIASQRRQDRAEGPCGGRPRRCYVQLVLDAVDDLAAALRNLKNIVINIRLPFIFKGSLSVL